MSRPWLQQAQQTSAAMSKGSETRSAAGRLRWVDLCHWPIVVCHGGCRHAMLLCNPLGCPVRGAHLWLADAPASGTSETVHGCCSMIGSGGCLGSKPLVLTQRRQLSIALNLLLAGSPPVLPTRKTVIPAIAWSAIIQADRYTILQGPSATGIHALRPAATAGNQT